MGDTAADGTSQGEASVQGSAGGGDGGLLLDGGHDDGLLRRVGSVMKERREGATGGDHAPKKDKQKILGPPEQTGAENGLSESHIAI